jgi:CDP-6-deoxy-D-xylo-4-hexulose-3-dehydrase
MNTPVKLQYAKGIYAQEEKDAVMRALDSGWLSNGMETLNFEKEFATWWGIKHALSVNSGSSANLVALQSLGLPKNSEIITPAGGAFPTTVAPMIYLGLKPVFIDVKGLCIDPDLIEQAITKKTSAIVFAHTIGFSPDIERIMEIAKKYGLKVFEDCCDAVGSKINGKPVGTFGDVATVSFYPAHHMTTGEGGMVITNNDNIYHEANSIRDWGRDCVCRMDKPNPVCVNRWSRPNFDHRYYYTRIGLNFKMNEMTAAFGREQLKRLDGFITLRKRNYKILAVALGQPNYPDMSPFCYPLFSKNRAEDMKRLEEAGIETRVLFSGNLLKHPAYKNIGRVVGELTESNRLFKECYFVGVGPHLTEENMLYIAEQISALPHSPLLSVSH